MKTINVFGAIKAGWDSFTKRPLYLFGISASILLLFIVTASDSAAATALSYIVYGGYIALMIKHLEGVHVKFDDVFMEDTRWINFAFVSLIKGFLIFLGLILFVIPGIYLGLRWMFAELLVIDKKMKPMEALAKSAEMTEGIKWKLLGFSLLAFLIALLGIIVLVVGLFAATAVITLASIKL